MEVKQYKVNLSINAASFTVKDKKVLAGLLSSALKESLREYAANDSIIFDYDISVNVEAIDA